MDQFEINRTRRTTINQLTQAVSLRDRKISNSLFAATLVTLISWAGCAPLMAGSHTANHRHPTLLQAPPSPSSVPPNASRIIATVRQYIVWPPGSLEKAIPPVARDQTLYSFVLEIQSSEPEKPDLDSRAQPGMVVEAFSSDALPSDFVSKKIRATLKLTGDTRGVHWLISNVTEVP
jgi:hypothetical protein